jgi:capsular exopolysaccharide synthesis family protein
VSAAAAAATLRDHFGWARRVLRRGRLTVAMCVLLFVGPTLLYLQQVTPRFTATAQLLIVADETDTLLDRTAGARFRPPDTLVQNEAAILASRPLARRVIDKLGLDDDPEFNVRLRKPDPVATAIARLNPLSWIPETWRNENADASVLSVDARRAVDEARIASAVLARLEVETTRRSQVITLRFTSESREKAALVVNTLAELYVLERLESGFDETRRVTTWLADRLEALRRDVAAADRAVETYRTEFGLARRNERLPTVNEQQLTELNSRLVLSRADLAQKRARLDQVRSLTTGRGSIESSTDVLQSPLIQRLREQEAVLQREISEASKTYAERHPRLVGLRADIGELRSKIGQEIVKIAASVENEVRVAEVGVTTIERQLADLQSRQERAGEASVRLRELEREAEAGRELYEAFLARFKRNAEQEGIQRANARILSPADIPLRPSQPRKPPALLIALMLGLVTGVGLIFLADRLDSLVRTTEDAEAVSGLPVLAVVPLAGRKDRGKGQPEEVVVNRPRSAMSDALRSLRTAAELADVRDPDRDDEPSDPDRGRIVLVTSSVPQEGKTFVSVSLARLYAQAGRRVLLIDGDVHRARAHQALGLANGKGLIEVTRGGEEFGACVVRDPLSPLDVLTAGVGASNTAEVLSDPAVAKLLETLRGRYDRIVVDSPPVLAVADARALAVLADQVICLVRWSATPRDAFRNAIRILRGSGARLSGVVLSRVDVRKYDRYAAGDAGSYYGRYADYYAD